MIGRNANDKHRPRRIVLLSSAAGLALALLIAGPGGYLPAWSFAAQAGGHAAARDGLCGSCRQG